MQLGDEIHAVYGRPVPLVLWPYPVLLPQNSATAIDVVETGLLVQGYHLIGYAYLPGTVDGEVFRELAVQGEVGPT